MLRLNCDFTYTVRKGQEKKQKKILCSLLENNSYQIGKYLSYLFIYNENIYTKKWEMMVGPDHKKILSKNQPSKQQQKENA